MAFPNDIETGIGIAGPTADIGHEAAHAASGIPRLFEAIQTSIGTNTGGQTLSLTWNTSIAPANNYSRWCQIGPLVWVFINVQWTAYATTTGGVLQFTNPPWDPVTSGGQILPGFYLDSSTQTYLPAYASVGGSSTIRYVWQGSQNDHQYREIGQIGAGDYVTVSGVISVA